jgi:energy-coupling factor transport system permease protein
MIRANNPTFMADTWLFRLDPRTKLWVASLAILVCLVVDRLDVLAAALLVVHLVLLMGGISLRQIWHTWRGLALLLSFVLIGQPLLASRSGEVVWQVASLRITDAGLLAAARYALRLSTAAFAVLIPILTTPTNTLVRGLQKIGLPYNWGMTIGLALRYLGTIGDLYTMISQAQQARGVDLSKGGLVKRVRMLLPTVIALIIASLRLSDSLALGLAARGFGLDRQRTTWRDIHLQALDWFVLAGATATCGGMLLFFFATA